MRSRHLLALSLAAVALQGCVARTATKIVTAPVKVVSSGVDAATTSQSEADEARGREAREREEQLSELQRDLDKQSERCAKGDKAACDKAKAIEAEMKTLMAATPGE
jgi:hypothetical protein